MATTKTRNPHAGRRRGSGKTASVSRAHITRSRRLYSTSDKPCISTNLRAFLRNPDVHYADRVERLGKPCIEGEEHGR